jgi:hypothetical protein
MGSEGTYSHFIDFWVEPLELEAGGGICGVIFPMWEHNNCIIGPSTHINVHNS